VRVALVLLAVLAALCVAGEVAARRLLDGVVEDAVAAGLRRASTDGTGFATVDAGEQGWAAPDLLRGRLSGVEAEAVDGDIDGLPLERVVLRTGEVDLGGRTADDVVVTASMDGARLLRLAGRLLGEELAGGAVSAVADDTVRFTGGLSGGAVTADVRVAAAADGGLVAEPVAATVDGRPLDPAALVPSGPVHVERARLPAGTAVTEVRVSEDAGGARVEVVLECPSGCALEAGV
jgi:hypothetical protein